jgi:hypothetical protein
MSCYQNISVHSGMSLCEYQIIFHLNYQPLQVVLPSCAHMNATVSLNLHYFFFFIDFSNSYVKTIDKTSGTRMLSSANYLFYCTIQRFWNCKKIPIFVQFSETTYSCQEQPTQGQETLCSEEMYIDFVLFMNIGINNIHCMMQEPYKKNHIFLLRLFQTLGNISLGQKVGWPNNMSLKKWGKASLATFG